MSCALEILQNIPDDFKFSYLHENAGHYGIFYKKALERRYSSRVFKLYK